MTFARRGAASTSDTGHPAGLSKSHGRTDCSQCAVATSAVGAGVGHDKASAVYLNLTDLSSRLDGPARTSDGAGGMTRGPADLPCEQRRAIDMAYHLGLSHREIAATPG